MNRVALLAVLAVVAVLGACGAGGAAQRRRAYVDYQRALVTVCEGRAARAALRREFEEKQRRLDARASELAAARTELETQGAAMSEGERRGRQAELQRRDAELRSLFGDLRKELSEHERTATRDIFDRMSPLSHELSAALGYSQLLEGNGSGPRDAHDLTNELVARYDHRFPVDGCTSPDGPRTVPEAP